MVTKQDNAYLEGQVGLILAKIHMVTKRRARNRFHDECLILAKIHMVTKQRFEAVLPPLSLILAKIHMVTKRGTTIQL